MATSCSPATPPRPSISDEARRSATPASSSGFRTDGSSEAVVQVIGCALIRKPFDAHVDFRVVVLAAIRTAAVDGEGRLPSRGTAATREPQLGIGQIEKPDGTAERR